MVAFFVLLAGMSAAHFFGAYQTWSVIAELQGEYLIFYAERVEILSGISAIMVFVLTVVPAVAFMWRDGRFLMYVFAFLDLLVYVICSTMSIYLMWDFVATHKRQYHGARLPIVSGWVDVPPTVDPESHLLSEFFEENICFSAVPLAIMFIVSSIAWIVFVCTRLYRNEQCMIFPCQC